mgnify:CR=1 FL=1
MKIQKIVLTVVLLLSMVLSACQPAPVTPEPVTPETEPDLYPVEEQTMPEDLTQAEDTYPILDENKDTDGAVGNSAYISDPKASAEADSETGIVVVGLGQDGRGYVIADYSIDGTPEQWAQRVAYAYEQHSADRVIVEVNQGGDMVSSVLR